MTVYICQHFNFQYLLYNINIGKNEIQMEIRKEALQPKNNSEFVVREGSRVRSWEDNWCRPNPLYIYFLTLYSLGDPKGAKVAEIWEALGVGVGGCGLVGVFVCLCSLESKIHKTFQWLGVGAGPGLHGYYSE